MKKVTLIVQAKDREACVKEVSSLGALHVQHQVAPQGKDISCLQDGISLLNNACEAFGEKKGLHLAPEGPLPLQDWRSTARHCVEISKRVAQLQAYLRTLHAAIAEWEPWGNIDPVQIQKIHEKGIYTTLYQVPLKELNSFPENCVVQKIFARAGIVRVAVFSREKIEVPFKELTLPRMSLVQMCKRIEEDARAIHQLNEQLMGLRHQKPYFEKKKVELEKSLELQKAVAGMAQAGALTYIVGFIPLDKVEALCAYAKSHGRGVVVQEPSEEDSAPTLLRNPRWVTLIKPVFNLLGILPGYRELDVSLLFLVFFSIFFGILIGDAGYGLSYFLLTLWFQKKRGDKVSRPHLFFLFYVLSFCAIIWGALTGSFFGQSWLIKRGFQPLIPALNDPVTMQTFCFFIGALHLSIAHSWRAMVKFPSPSALADIGWICVLWTAFFLARTLILAQAFPVFGKWLLVSGIILVIFFTHPQRNIVRAIGAGLGTLALSLMNNFTDVVSYVRLFAVGLAGVAIAETTNSMAASLGTGLIAVIAGIGIAVIGHMLNLVLGPMSVLVHGVRLNVLEFSGHASVTWSGEAYKPLAE